MVSRVLAAGGPESIAVPLSRLELPWFSLPRTPLAGYLAYGCLLAMRDCDVIALHDCDIVNYERHLLARLCYPVAHPNLGFEFCKDYYARVTDRMHGRVTRLFMTPLIRTLESMAPGAPFLKFLDSFRYPLAGFWLSHHLGRSALVWAVNEGIPRPRGIAG